MPVYAAFSPGAVRVTLRNYGGQLCDPHEALALSANPDDRLTRIALDRMVSGGHWRSKVLTVHLSTSLRGVQLVEKGDSGGWLRV